MKGVLNRASRVAGALERRNETDTAEYSNLKAKILMVEKAASLSQQLQSLSLADRVSQLSSVASERDPLPQSFSVRWLLMAVRDIQFNKAADVDEWLRRVRPCCSQTGPASRTYVFDLPIGFLPPCHPCESAAENIESLSGLG